MGTIRVALAERISSLPSGVKERIRIGLNIVYEVMGAIAVLNATQVNKVLPAYLNSVNLVLCDLLEVIDLKFFTAIRRYGISPQMGITYDEHTYVLPVERAMEYSARFEIETMRFFERQEKRPSGFRPGGFVEYSKKPNAPSLLSERARALIPKLKEVPLTTRQCLIESDKTIPLDTQALIQMKRCYHKTRSLVEKGRMTPEKVWQIRSSLVPVKKKLECLKTIGRDTTRVEIAYITVELLLDSVSTIIGDRSSSHKKVMQHLDRIHELSIALDRGPRKIWCEVLHAFFLELQRKARPPIPDNSTASFEFMRFDGIVQSIQRLACSAELGKTLDIKTGAGN